MMQAGHTELGYEPLTSMRAALTLRLFVATVVAGALFTPAKARAFCRATPCDPSSGTCKTDAHGCSTEGPHLYWPGGKVRLNVDDGGSPLRGISGDDAVAAVSEALGAWQTATCKGGEHPVLSTKVTQVSGAKAGFASSGANQSVVLFRDDLWPYEQNAVAKTTVGLDLDTGEILDADIQLDSERFDLTVEPDAGGIDLVAVLTHEIGHVLGLGHSDVKGATMQPETTGFGTIELRSLEPDDMSGICAIYGPAVIRPTAPDPGGPVNSSSCAVGRPLGAMPSAVSAVAFALVLGLRRRRRS
jgi:hypothetical protein